MPSKRSIRNGVGGLCLGAVIAIAGLMGLALPGQAGAFAPCEWSYTEHSDFHGADTTLENLESIGGQVQIIAGKQTGTWSAIQDSLNSGTVFGTVSWTGDEPAGATLGVKVRAADTRVALAGQPYLEAGNGIDFSGSGIAGRYLEVLVSMERGSGGASPVLYDLSLACFILDPPACEDITICADPGQLFASRVDPAWLAGTFFDPDDPNLLVEIIPGGPYHLGDNPVVVRVTDRFDPFLPARKCDAVITVVDLAIKLEAFCAIPKAPGSDDRDDCEGSKVTAISIAYTAEDCSATSHSQDSGKVACEDFGTLTYHVFVVVSDEDHPFEARAGKGATYFAGPVTTAVPFEATAAHAGADRFRSNTYLHVFAGQAGQLLQSVEFHTSCSQPLAVGDQFGANAIIGLSFTDGRAVTRPAPDSGVKECKIPVPGGEICPAGDDLYSVELLYTGDDCSATSHRQDSGKAGCQDFGALPGTAWVVVSGERNASRALSGSGKTYFAGPVEVNSLVTATAARAGADKFRSRTYLHVFAGPGGDLRQSVEFHTSCSQPLYTGDQFGAFALVGANTKEAGQVSLMVPALCTRHCEVEVSTGEICPEGGKLSEIELLYTAEDCSATRHAQDSGKASCRDRGPLKNTVYVIVSDVEKSKDALARKGRTYFAGFVTLNELFTATAEHAGRDTFSSATFIHVFAGPDGGLLQAIEFHTSCSQPLTTHDQFGAFAVFGAHTKKHGKVSDGITATFLYEVSNPGTTPLHEVVVNDLFGEVDGSPIPNIEAGERVTLFRVVTTTEDLHNAVTAISDDGFCKAMSTVTLIPPPPGPIECDSKVQGMLLTYIGPDRTGPVTVVFSPNKGANVTYSLPGGLPTGTTLSSPAQNGFTIDALAAGETELGSKVFISINGLEPDSGIHTSCSAPFHAHRPAPLNEPKGDSSPNWFVESFRQKD